MNMDSKHIRGLLTVGIIMLWAGLTLFAWLKPPAPSSDAERRMLAQMPQFSGENLLSGSYMTQFDSYATDQFPYRQWFRQLKAGFHYNVLSQKDNNGIYLVDGVAAKLEYPLNDASIQHAISVFSNVHDRYLKGTDCKIYQAVVPDKGYYLAQNNGFPAIDYKALFNRITNSLPWAAEVDLTDCLTADDYYRTDTHWRQERLLKAAGRLCEAMGAPFPRQDDYTPTPLDVPFYGVYYGQAAIPMEPETIYMLENELLSQCTVYNYETGKTTSIYDMAKRSSKDLYDIYLSGAAALLRIDNPNATTDRELVVFRDSFGSSIIPLLVQGYKTITVVDLRYMQSSLLAQFMEFSDQDVLFLYSTLVLNDSNALKG
jgi:hypothetical protein